MWHKKIVTLLYLPMLSILLTLAGSELAPAFAANEQAPSTEPQVNLTQYMGKWYEIARFPMFFQRNCDHNTTATYTLQGDKVDVENKCYSKKNDVILAKGEASAIDATNSKLLVSFLPKFMRSMSFGRAPYWILKVDKNYQVALVGNPTRSYLWLLSRTPTLDEMTYTAYVEEARKQGFDTTKLIRTKQVYAADDASKK